MATGTPTIFAAPIQEANAVVAAWNADIVPSPSDFLNILPKVCRMAKGKYRNWTNPNLIVMKILPPTNITNIGIPHSQLEKLIIALIILCIISLLLSFYIKNIATIMPILFVMKSIIHIISKLDKNNINNCKNP
jgi:hypothetical protein